MAHRALPPGAVRRRTAFGLFDADGWPWASLKAAFWFLVIIFLLGYLPDRAYYFTVLPTLDVGYNVISPINWCSERNRGLPCPPPAGAIVPWDHEPPPELLLPEPRTDANAFNLAENVYVAGGRTPAGVTASVLGTVMQDDNLTGWFEAPALPEPRADAALAVVSGVPHVIGGVGADGNPTSTVFRGILEEGLLSGWEEVPDLALPVSITDASAVPAARGIYLFGGRVDGTLTDTVYVSELSAEATPRLQPWVELAQVPLPEPRAEASAVTVATSVYVLGGEGPDGVSDSVFYLRLDAEGRPISDPETGVTQGWGVSVGQAAEFALPEPRMRHTSLSNSGAMYVIGGEDAEGNLATTTYWAVPDSQDGTIPEWQRLDVTDLRTGRADAAAVALGAALFVIGGETERGPTDTLLRANLAPAVPFFRLGLFGMTIPALSIPGEIGQQLGYIAAAGVGTGNFILLVIIGLAYSHPRTTMRVIERISRGRFRAPPEEEVRR